MSSQSIIINEQVLLNLCKNNPEYLVHIENFFLSDIAKTLYNTFKKLYLEKMELTNQNILMYCNTDKIDEPLLNSLSQVRYTLEYFDNYYEKLKKEYAKKELDKTHKDIFVDLQSKNELSLEKWETYKNSIDQSLAMIKGYQSPLITGQEKFDRYYETLNLRASGKMKYDIGCSYLNEHLVYGAYPGMITTVFASTGMSKSSFVLNLNVKQSNKFIPNLMLSLENSFDMTMDREVANKLGIEAKDLIHIDEDSYDYIINEYQKLRPEFIKNKFSYLIAGELVNFDLLEKTIIDAKRRMNKDYLIATVDLGSHLDGFGEKPEQMIRSMKILQMMAKRQNIHFVLVFQANRDTDKIKVNTKEDIEKLRPNLNNLYGGSAMAQGSQAVLGIFRKKHYMEKYFPDDPELDIIDDIAEVAILKQNGGNCKTLKYLFDPKVYNFYRYIED